MTVTCIIHRHEMTYCYPRHNSSRFAHQIHFHSIRGVIRLVNTWGKSHEYLWHYSFIHMTWRIHMSLHATWRIHPFDISGVVGDSRGALSPLPSALVRVYAAVLYSTSWYALYTLNPHPQCSCACTCGSAYMTVFHHRPRYAGCQNVLHQNVLHLPLYAVLWTCSKTLERQSCLL